MRRICFIAFLGLVPLLLQAKVFKIQFDSQRTKSGAKVAIKDINAQLPEDWSNYKYVGVELRASTTQRFLLGFTTDKGYNELMLHSYVPGQWNRLIIPLIYLSQPPASSHDMASMYNKPRQTGWINLGGTTGPMIGVDSIGIRQNRPLKDAWVEVRNIELFTEDPGDLYFGKKPAIDELGQSNLVKWPGKANSLKELKKIWKAEEEEEVSAENLYGYSRYGGYLSQKTKATGFFHKEKKDGCWWLVDPDGYRFLSVGVCCISPAGGGNVKDLDKRTNMLEQLPPEKFIYKDRRGNRTADYSTWNLERRFGPNFEQPSIDLTIKRMDKWGVNTIGNWSDRRMEKSNRKAFTCTMHPAGVDGSLFGIGDPYEPDFKQRLEASLRPLMEGYRDNPWLIGYFVGNEPTWVGAEDRLCTTLLNGRERAMKKALQAHIAKHGDSKESRVDFVYETFDLYLTAIKEVQQRIDPNHMNLGYRFGNAYAVTERLAAICAKYFDVMSFNGYAVKPDDKLMDRLLKWSGLPMIIGEFHFGATDHGLGQSLYQVSSQYNRGQAYRYYVEQGFTHPGLVGVTYFTWNDQDILGRFDGENYNCGLIDVTNIPYREQTEAMMETARRLRAIHAGEEQPFANKPSFIVGLDRGEDVW